MVNRILVLIHPKTWAIFHQSQRMPLDKVVEIRKVNPSPRAIYPKVSVLKINDKARKPVTITSCDFKSSISFFKIACI